MGDEERDPIDIDMRPVQDQVDDMLKGFKEEQLKQMKVYQAQMAAQKELNRFSLF